MLYRLYSRRFYVNFTQVTQLVYVCIGYTGYTAGQYMYPFIQVHVA